MFEEHADRIRAEAIEAYPLEAVWLITDDGQCKQVKNCATDPKRTFRIGKKAMAAAHGRGLAAIVHSHPDYPDCPSADDMHGQMETAVPWGIVATDGQAATPIRWWGPGVERAPLDDRYFVHGITDCYAAIRDWFAVERDITLRDFARDWNWWEGEGDLYRDHFAAAGFERIDKALAEPGDVFLAQFGRGVSVPHHGGVLLPMGACYHHLASREPVDTKRHATTEPVNRWQPYITHVLRYVG